MTFVIITFRKNALSGIGKTIKIYVEEYAESRISSIFFTKKKGKK